MLDKILSLVTKVEGGKVPSTDTLEGAALMALQCLLAQWMLGESPLAKAIDQCLERFSNKEDELVKEIPFAERMAIWAILNPLRKEAERVRKERAEQAGQQPA